MKRTLCALLILALLGAGGALAESGSFADVAGTYEFASGVGAWYTELTILENGAFYGVYSDTDMDGGELNGEPYEATTYGGEFSGRLSPLEHASAQELDCTVIELSYETGEPYVADGVLRVFTEPNGLSLNARLRFFMRGAYRDALPEGLLSWIRAREADIAWETMPYTALYNETDDAGFSGIDVGADIWLPAEPQSPSATAAIQWSFITPEPDDIGGPAPAMDGDGGDIRAPAPAYPEGDAGISEPAPAASEGIAFPVQAEVVNCKKAVSLRGGPSTKAALLAEVPLGELASVYSNAAWLGNDRWFVDASYNGQRGYICIEYLDILLPEELRYQTGYLRDMAGTVSAVNPGTDLIMRSGPGTGYDDLGLLFGGEVLGYRGDARQDAAGTCWYHCSYYGAECWISAKYTALTLNDGTTYTGGRGIF